MILIYPMTYVKQNRLDRIRRRERRSFWDRMTKPTKEEKIQQEVETYFSQYERTDHEEKK